MASAATSHRRSPQHGDDGAVAVTVMPGALKSACACRSDRQFSARTPMYFALLTCAIPAASFGASSPVVRRLARPTRGWPHAAGQLPRCALRRTRGRRRLGVGVATLPLPTTQSKLKAGSRRCTCQHQELCSYRDTDRLASPVCLRGCDFVPALLGVSRWRGSGVRIRRLSPKGGERSPWEWHLCLQDSAGHVSNSVNVNHRCCRGVRGIRDAHCATPFRH